MADRRLLEIYLNDHLAAARAGEELARRSLANNRGSELGAFLERLVAEIAEDKGALERLMADLGVAKSPWKERAAVLAERAGRLKLNGQVRGYSPLSRLLELEGLTVAVAGKRSLWLNLREAANVDPDATSVDFDSLLARAEAQLAELERHRVKAAGRALTG